MLASNDTQMVTRKYFTVPGIESILISSRNVIIRSAKAVIQMGNHFSFSSFISIFHTHTSNLSPPTSLSQHAICFKVSVMKLTNSKLLEPMKINVHVLNSHTIGIPAIKSSL